MTGRPDAGGGEVDGSRPRFGSRAAFYDRGYRRSIRLGLTISALLHALLILGLSRQLYIGARPYRAVETPPRSPLGMQVIDYRAIDSESIIEEIIELPPDERDEIRRPEPPIPGQGRPVPGAGADEGPGMTNAERLQPREGDPRLWQDYVDRPLPEYLRDRFGVAEGELRARLGAMLDSLQLSEEERRRAVEWLIGEGDQQWGVTEDGLVLGGMVIPMNVGALFQAEGPLGRELRQQGRDLQDIRRQDFETDVERVQQERLDDMRRRSQEEAERRAQDTARVVADSTDEGVPPPRD